MPARSKLAQVIARMEGFGKAGATPTVRHNPGDLRHGPHAQHPGDPNAVATYATDDIGWDDLENQLQKYAARSMSVQQMVDVYAPPNENNSGDYLKFVCEALDVKPADPVSFALRIPAARTA